MGNRISSLCCKEVVNVCDGARLGYVSDVEIELPGGRVTALLVPGSCRFFGLFGFFTRGENLYGQLSVSIYDFVDSALDVVGQLVAP